MWIFMRRVQMTIDEDLVVAVDEVVKKLKTTRSSFIRETLREAIHQFKVREQELKHRKGYGRKPVGKDEFSVWEKKRNLSRVEAAN